MKGVRRNPLNGRITMVKHSNEDANTQEVSSAWYWSSTENSQNNAWYVNFSNGNTNNNNKYNSNRVRAVAAYGKDFECFLETVIEAYKDCLRGKMSSKQAVEYMQIAEEDIVCLAIEMWTGVYKPATSTCFLVRYPKLREVFAANFRDRIVHHWICLRLEPLFEERFVSQGNVSHNCRRGFGTRSAVESAEQGMKKVSDGYRRPAWVFKGDLVSFFMSIDRTLLLGKLLRFAEKKYHGEYKEILLRLVRVIVLHSPEKDCLFNSNPALWQELPANKSLLRNGEGKGGPIGNLTTQLFANFLMSFFDTYVRWIMRGVNYHYVRFVDDFLLICDDLKALQEVIPEIESFLATRLKLKLHKDKRYLRPVSHGVLFVGVYIKPGRSYLSNRTLGRFKEKVIGFNRLAETTELTSSDCIRIQSVLNSYLGFCKGLRTYRKRKEIFSLLSSEFYKYFYISGHYEKVCIRKKHKFLSKDINYVLPNSINNGKKKVRRETIGSGG